MAWLVKESKCDTPLGTPRQSGHTRNRGADGSPTPNDTGDALYTPPSPPHIPASPDVPWQLASTSMPPEEPRAVCAEYRTSQDRETVDKDESLVHSRARGSNTTCAFPSGWCNNE